MISLPPMKRLPDVKYYGVTPPSKSGHFDYLIKDSVRIKREKILLERISALESHILGMESYKDEFWVDELGNRYDRPAAYAYAMVCMALKKEREAK